MIPEKAVWRTASRIKRRINLQAENPVLRGFHPDPSLIRVEDDYYLAVSTFEWLPGVAVYHSRNLAEWEYISSPIDNKEKADLRGCRASDGIWAPCLSYDGELFYLIYTVVHSAREFPPMDTHNYLITAKQIEGPWSDPVYLNSSGFDPSIFHDRDGRKWILNMEWDHRGTFGGNPFAGIRIQEYDPEEKRLVGEPVTIFKGTRIGSTEGPNLYRIGDYYYLFTAEGGTGWFHAVTVARSKCLLGPYEVHPGNPILSSYEGSFDGTKAAEEFPRLGPGSSLLKKAGHASLVEDGRGNWYLAHLCARTIPGTEFCPMGRETAIQEIEWREGWPYLKGGGRLPKSSFHVENEELPAKEAAVSKAVRYTFDKEDFRKDFLTLRVFYEAAGMTVTERKGALRIYGGESIFSRFDQALIARRQTDFSFCARTEFEFVPRTYRHGAGLIYRYDEKNQYYAYISYNEQLQGTVAGLMAVMGGKATLYPEVRLDGPRYLLGLTVQNDLAEFFYEAEGVRHRIGERLPVTCLSDDFADGFTGSFVGMCVQDMEGRNNYADFLSFTYEVM